MAQWHEPTIEEWKQGVWDYLLEHCDITVSGKMFVKFHTDGRKQFENHIKARVVHGYHREDPRLKEGRVESQARTFTAEQKAKHEKWRADRDAARMFQRSWRGKILRVAMRSALVQALLRTHGK